MKKQDGGCSFVIVCDSRKGTITKGNFFGGDHGARGLMSSEKQNTKKKAKAEAKAKELSFLNYFVLRSFNFY